MKKLSLILLPFAFVFNANSQNAKSNDNAKRYHYRDSIVSIEKWFGDDEKIDSLKTYYKTGAINEVLYFKKGLLHGKGYKFNEAGKKITTWQFKRGKTVNRINHTTSYKNLNLATVNHFFTELELVNKKLLDDPSDLLKLQGRANIRVMLNDRILALFDFLELEKIYSDSKSDFNKMFLSTIYYNIGQIYSKFENDNKTLEYKYKRLSINTQSKENLVSYMVANYNFGAYLYTIKAYRLAFHYLNIVLKKWKKHGFANRTIADLYTDLGQYRLALSHAETAFPKEDTIIKYSSGKPVKDLRTIRGWLYHKTGKTDKGIKDLTEALEINDKNLFAHRYLGLLYHDMENYQSACNHLKKAKDLDDKKVFNEDDLEAYLKSSCANKSIVKTETVSKYEKLTKSPYIFPNPIKDYCTVKNFEHHSYNYEIYDMTSNLIIKNRTASNKIDLSSLPQGIYHLNVINDSIITTFLIIKED